MGQGGGYRAPAGRDYARCSFRGSTLCPPSSRHSSLKAVPPGQTPLSRAELAERIIADALPVRFQVQLHKVLWPAQQRGV